EFISEVVFNHDEIKLTPEDLRLSGKFQATFKTKLWLPYQDRVTLIERQRQLLTGANSKTDAGTEQYECSRTRTGLSR
ncbi:MAG TPA: hypothetical protein VIJ87_02295, partial [Pyrinomonadaceae bacterium]